MPSFFHYQKTSTTCLCPSMVKVDIQVRRQMRLVRALSTCSTDPRTVERNGVSLTFEHEVRIASGDPMLEEEDHYWMPHTWIYRRPIDVAAVKMRDTAMGVYKSTSTVSPREEITVAAFLNFCARGRLDGYHLEDWLAAKAQPGFK